VTRLGRRGPRALSRAAIRSLLIVAAALITAGLGALGSTALRYLVIAAQRPYAVCNPYPPIRDPVSGQDLYSTSWSFSRVFPVGLTCVYDDPSRASGSYTTFQDIGTFAWYLGWTLILVALLVLIRLYANYRKVTVSSDQVSRPRSNG